MEILPWPRPVLGRPGFHQEQLLQLCTAVRHSEMRHHPGARPRPQISGTAGVSNGQGWQPRASLGHCRLPPPAGSGSCVPKATPPLSPPFLLAGRHQSCHTVLHSYPLGDELSRSLPSLGPNFPFSIIKFCQALRVPVPSLHGSC